LWPTRQLATWLCEACGALWVDTGNGEPLEMSRIKWDEKLHRGRVTVEGDNRDLMWHVTDNCLQHVV
jgi:hypothetical protein